MKNWGAVISGILLICATSVAFTQKVIPFVDFNNYFRTFENENFRMLEFQAIKEFKAGDEFVAYIDNRGNLRIYDGENRKDISNLNVEYEVSDHLMAYKIGPTLNMWEEGKLQTLTYFARNFAVMDSIIVYEDTRFNTVNVYWNKQKIVLYTLTGDLYMPIAIGDNIIAFKDNGNFYKVFWQGNIFDLGVWNNKIDFQAGSDMLCFNDPTTRTFALFEKGQFLDVEPFFVPKYKSGRGFLVYEDLNGNLILYKDGKKTQLSNFAASNWEVKDDLVVWSENSFFYAYQNDSKVQVANFKPKDFEIKNNTLVFRNILGGVSALVDGKVEELTNQMDAGYKIYGNSVLVELFNKSFIVYSNGRKYFN